MDIMMASMGYVMDFMGIIWRGTMKPIFVNWRIRNLERALNNGDIRIKAHKHEYLPYLSLLCVINNRSEVGITIKRVFGSIYIGDWRIGHFDVSEVSIKQVGVNRQQCVTVTSKSIKKGQRSELEFTFYPPMDFWILGQDSCSLGNGGIEIHGGGVKAMIPLWRDNIKIEDMAQVCLDYRKILKKRLNTVLREVEND